MTEPVLIAVDQGVMIITINRPEAKNAINRATAVALAEAMDRLDGDDSICAAILTGAGGSFCSGMDLKAYVAGELPVVEGRGFAGLVEAPPRKPLIAAVEGFALAGGFEIMLCCDLIVAGNTAFFGIPEVKRGLVAAGGGLLRMPQQMPQRIAMELALTGDYINADRALEMGLINRSVEPGSALQEARQLADKIAANGPLAVAKSKEVMVNSLDWGSDEMFAKQMEVAAPVFTSQDAIEGATAFAEKRAPRWTGK